MLTSPVSKSLYNTAACKYPSSFNVDINPAKYPLLLNFYINSWEK